MRRRKGRVKTKNETSSPNWGSLTPKGSALNQRRTVRHCAASVAPMNRPDTATIAQKTSRRMGATCWR